MALAVLCVSVDRTDGMVINGGFETRDLTGWTVNAPEYPWFYGVFNEPLGRAMVVNDPAHAREGHSYVEVYNGNPVLDAGDFKYVSISQEIYLTAGQDISGWADFETTDYLYVDAGWVTIRPKGTPFPTDRPVDGFEVIWGSLGVGHLSTRIQPPTHWEFWSWEAPVSGFYILELGSSTPWDGQNESAAYFDQLSAPDSGSTLLSLCWALGAFGWFSWLTRRNRGLTISPCCK